MGTFRICPGGVVMRCKNCGKLKTSHYDATEHKYGGVWCYSIKNKKPEDEGYFMKYEEGSPNLNKESQDD